VAVAAVSFGAAPRWPEALIGWGQRDGAAPTEVLDGIVEVLKRWSRTWERPVAVGPIPPGLHPELVASVAEHVARIGRLPLVEALEVTGPPPTAEAASAVR